MVKKISLKQELLVNGFIRRLSKICATDIKNICVDFYWENPCFIVEDGSYQLKNNNKTIISKPEKPFKSFAYCDNFVIYRRNKMDIWTFKVEAKSVNAKIYCGVNALFPLQGNIKMFWPMKKLKQVFKQDDVVEIRFIFTHAHFIIKVNINGKDCGCFRFQEQLIVLNKFTPGWQTKVAGIKISLIDYMTMNA